jgi:hypothetical protein
VFFELYTFLPWFEIGINKCELKFNAGIRFHGSWFGSLSLFF